MWPRIGEVILSVWVFASPLLLDGSRMEVLVARVAGLAMLLTSTASLFEPLRRAYLVTLLLSVAMAAYPFTAPAPASALAQGMILTGLTIAMFAVIPSEATRPPRRWRASEDESFSPNGRPRSPGRSSPGRRSRRKTR